MVEILIDFWGGCLQMMTPYNLLIILLGSLVGLYAFVGIILSILVFCKVLK